MFLHLMISLKYLLLYLARTQSRQIANNFPCGQTKCYTDKAEVWVETIEEKDDKLEQFCQAGRFWNECAELGCKHNRCRTFIITTYDGRQKTPIVTCEISNKFPRERIFNPKPPYKLHPESHELLSVLALFICVIPFLVFGAFIGVSMCGLSFHPKNEIQDDTDDGGVNEIEELKSTSDEDQNKTDENNHLKPPTAIR